VFDSGVFFKNLEQLAENTFQSKEAKDFINIAKGFNELFKNDILIAQAIKPTTTQKIGSSIATSIEGAAKFQVVRMLFSQITRLMPHIPFMKGLNEQISGAALRFHLRAALENSASVSEFKQVLKEKAQRSKFNNQTNEIISKITSNVDNAQDEIIKVAEDTNAKAQELINNTDILTQINEAKNLAADSFTIKSPADKIDYQTTTSLPTTTKNTDDIAQNMPKVSENDEKFIKKQEEIYNLLKESNEFSAERINEFDSFRLIATPILKDFNKTLDDREFYALWKYTKLKVAREARTTSDLLDSSKPLRMAKREELSDELLERAIRQDSKIWIDNFTNPTIAKEQN